MPPNHLKPPQTPRHKETRLFFFWGGVLEKGYCRDARTDFDAKYVKRCGSAQGSAFWGLRNQYQTTPFSALCAAIHSFVTGEPSYFTNLCYADDIFSGVKRELLDTVKARNLAYYGHTMRKQGSCLEKKIMQGIMPGARRRGRPRTVHCNPPTYYYYIRLTALCPGLPGWAGTRKVKPIWILLKHEIVSGSGISWAICKSAPRSRQITMPAPHHSVFYRPDALPAAQPTVSKH